MIARDKRYMIRGYHGLFDFLPKTALDAHLEYYEHGLHEGLRRSISWGATCLKKDIVQPSYDKCMKRLDHYKSKNANFVVFHLRNANDWQHLFAVKVDQSWTHGWLNSSYPCALFDPNIGQGMYSNHIDLAHDVNTLLLEYNSITGSWCEVDAYLIESPRID